MQAPLAAAFITNGQFKSVVNIQKLLAAP